MKKILSLRGKKWCYHHQDAWNECENQSVFFGISEHTRVHHRTCFFGIAFSNRSSKEDQQQNIKSNDNHHH